MMLNCVEDQNELKMHGSHFLGTSNLTIKSAHITLDLHLNFGHINVQTIF